MFNIYDNYNKVIAITSHKTFFLPTEQPPNSHDTMWHKNVMI